MGAEVPFVSNRRLLVEEDRRCDIPACNCGGSHTVRREPFDWEVMGAALPLVRKALERHDVREAVWEKMYAAMDGECVDDYDAAIAAVLAVLEEAGRG